MVASVNYTFCDTPSTFQFALQDLQRSSFLILDCEGNSLGRAEGCVSLICVGTPLAENIYIFDTLSPRLSPDDFEPLWQMFQNPLIIKIVWDGRMDFLEIWNTYGIRLEGVLDLQVAEVVSRVIYRGEGETERLKRLSHGCFSTIALKNYTQQYAGLHAVIGLQRCCEESGFGEDFGKDPEVKQMHKDKKGVMWMNRPLTEQLLQYAAKDIQLISMLCTNFIQKGWIPAHPLRYNELLQQSSRYVTAHQQQGKSSEADPFRPSGVMPLDVLTHPWGVQHQCLACNRTLSLTCFQFYIDGFYEYRSTRCGLCHALAFKYRREADIRWIAI